MTARQPGPGGTSSARPDVDPDRARQPGPGGASSARPDTVADELARTAEPVPNEVRPGIEFDPAVVAQIRAAVAERTGRPIGGLADPGFRSQLEGTQRGIFTEAGTSAIGSTRFMMTERDRLNAQMALESLDPELADRSRPDRVKAFVQQFEHAVAENPEIMDVFAGDDFFGEFAQTLPQWLDRRAAETHSVNLGVAEARTQLKLGMLNAMRDRIWTRDSRLLTVGQLVHDARIQKRGWEAGNAPALSDLGDFPQGPDRAGLWGDAGPELVQDFAKFEGRGAVWGQAGDDLAMRLSDKTGIWDVLVRLDPGTVIANNNQALKAVLDARNGYAHRLDETSDEVPRKQNLSGALWEGVGDVGRRIPGKVSDWVIDNIPTNLSTSAALARAAGGTGGSDAELRAAERQDHLVDAIRTATFASLSPAAIATYMARDLVQMGATSGEAVVLAAGEYLANPDAFDEETRNLIDQNVDAETVYEQFRLQEEDRNVLGELAESALNPVLDAVTYYDAVIHNIAIGTVEFLAGGAEAMVGVKPFNEVWTDVVDEVQSNSTFADYVDIDPSSNYGFWVNMGVSIFADPITYLTPGGKASWKWLAKAVNDEQLAARYVSQPHIRSYARNIVRRQGEELVWMEAGGGLPVPILRDLVKVSQTNFHNADDVARLTGKSVDEVGDVSKRAVRVGHEKEAEARILDNLADAMITGDWLPSSPTFVQARKGLLGLGRVVNTAAAGKAGPKEDRIIAQLLVRSSTNRELSLTPAEMMQDAVAQVLARFPNDPQKSNRILLELLDTVEDFRGGNDDFVRSTLQVAEDEKRAFRLSGVAAEKRELQYVQRFRDENLQLEQARRDLEVQVAGWREELASPGGVTPREENFLNNLIENAEAGMRQIDETITTQTRFIEADAPRFDDLTAQTQAHADRQTRLAAEIADAEGGYNTERLERWWAEWWDDWGEEAGVPKLTRENGSVVPHSEQFPDLPARDWKVVSGERFGKRQTPEPSVGRRDPFLDPERRAEHEAQLAAAGFQTRAVATSSPVSVHEMVAFHAASQVTGGTEWWTKMVKSRTAQHTKNATDAIGTVFSASVLFNLLTPFRSHLDEIIRFYAQTGQTLKSAKASLLIGDPSTRGLRVAEELGGTPFPTRDSGWTMLGERVGGKVPRGQRAAHIRAAERFINGSILEDLPFQKFAQAVGREGRGAQLRHWRQWWESEGHKYARRTVMRLEDGGTKALDLYADEAFDAIKRAWDIFVSNADNPTLVGDEILAAARTGDKIAASNKGFWRQVGPVPGREQGLGVGNRGVGRIFDELYGRPQRKRAGMFYDHYKEFRIGLLHQKYEGRILGLSPEFHDDTINLLTERFGYTPEQAVDAIRAGESNAHVRDLIRDVGYRLETDLEQIAHRWAERNTDSLMYTFGAVSALGRKSQRLYPFGRAQIDYLNYWGRELAAPLQLKIPGFSRVFTPSVAGRPIPFNLRLWDRMSKLGLFADDEDERFRPQFGTPEWVTETFTFLPTRFDESILLDIGPSPTPLVSWAVNWLPEDDQFRQLFEELHPTHRIFNQHDNNLSDIMGAFSNLFNAISPTTGRSVRSMFRALAEYLAARTGKNINDVLSLTEQFTTEAEAPFYLDHLMIGYSEWIAENAAGVLDFGEFEPGSPDDLALKQIQDDARRQAYDQDAWQRLTRAIPFTDGYSAQGSGLNAQPKLWLPALAQVDRWVEAGFISDGQRDDLNGTFSVIEEWMRGEGDAQFVDVFRFSDAIYDIYGQLPDDERAALLVFNPELSVNLVTTTEVNRDRVPQDVIESGVIIGNRIDPNLNGVDAREIRRRGREEGWITPRPDEDIFDDVRLRQANAQSDWLRSVFENATGKPWSSSGQTGDWPRQASFVPAESAQPGFDQLNLVPPDTFVREYRLPDGATWSDLSNSPPPPGAVLTGWWARNGDLKGWLSEMRESRGGPSEVNNNTGIKRLLRFSDQPGPETLSADLPIEQGDQFGISSFKQPEIVNDLSFYGRRLAKDYQGWQALVRREVGVNRISDWPDTFTVGHGSTFTWPDSTGKLRTVPAGFEFQLGAVRDELKERFRVAIELGHTVEENRRFTLELYNRYFADDFGPLDWEPPQPPPIGEIPPENRLTTLRPDQLQVVDGDTIQFLASDNEPVIFRIVGINAPEIGANTAGNQTVDAGARARLDLMRFLENANEVSFVIYNPELFGTTQLFKTTRDGAVVDRERIFAWLYVDGFPVYDPDVFTALNPRGVGVDTDPLHYPDLWRRPAPEGESA